MAAEPSGGEAGAYAKLEDAASPTLRELLRPALQSVGGDLAPFVSHVGYTSAPIVPMDTGMSFAPASLLPGLIFGCIGLAYFSYGKKLSKPLPLLSGLGLMILPYLIETPASEFAVGAVLTVLPFVARWF